MDFVRKSIEAIGQTAVRVKIESAAERCVKVLLELMATRVSYVVEAVVVMKVLLNCVEVFRLLLVLVLIVSATRYFDKLGMQTIHLIFVPKTEL